MNQQKQNTTRGPNVWRCDGTELPPPPPPEKKTVIPNLKKTAVNNNGGSHFYGSGPRIMREENNG